MKIFLQGWYHHQFVAEKPGAEMIRAILPGFRGLQRADLELQHCGTGEATGVVIIPRSHLCWRLTR